MSIVFKDFSTAYLAAPLAVGGLTITVDNPLAFPILSGDDYFYLVLQKYSDRSYVEIVKVTATAGAVFTVLRGQAGTSIRAFSLGDYAELRLTSDSLAEFVSQRVATKMDKSGGGDFDGLYRFLGASAGRIDLVRTPDDIVSSLLVDFSSTDGHRVIVGGAAGSNVVTPSILLRPNGFDNSAGQVKIDSSGLVDVEGLTVRGEQGTTAGSVVRYEYLGNFVPSIRKVNGRALSSDVTLSASDVKAAPDGFGLGDVQAFTVDDLDSDPLTWNGGKIGWIRATISSSGKPDDQLGVGLLHRYQSGASSVVHILFFGHNNKMYTRYWSGTVWSVWKSSFDSTNKPAVSDVTGLSDALAESGGSPVLSVAWVQLRSAMWNGYVAGDGGVFKRADYPDAWAAIQSGKVPVVSDADWLADPLKRCSFTTGDGSTTFRIPDYNGKYPGSIGALFQRGDGLNSAGANGVIQGDAIRDISGEFFIAPYSSQDTPIVGTETGPFKITRAASGAVYVSGITPTGSGLQSKVLFAASRVVPTAADNHPVSATGCWAVKLFGAVQNAGSIDAAGLATQLAEAKSEIAGLKEITTVTLNLQGNPSAGTAVLTKRGGIVVFRAWANVPSNWTDGTQLFDIPIGYRPHDSLLGAEFVSNIGKTDGDNGRLILRKAGLESWRLFGSSVYFRVSGSWICE